MSKSKSKKNIYLYSTLGGIIILFYFIIVGIFLSFFNQYIYHRRSDRRCRNRRLRRRWGLFLSQRQSGQADVFAPAVAFFTQTTKVVEIFDAKSDGG